jgi:hypothetical protein
MILPLTAGALRGRAGPTIRAGAAGTQHGAPETRDGIYQTARTAAKCLNDEDIMRWVTPPRRQAAPWPAHSMPKAAGTAACPW